MFWLARQDATQILAQWRSLAMVSFARAVLPSDDDCQRIIETLKQGPRTAVQLIESVPAERRAFVLRALAWMVKMGALGV